MSKVYTAACVIIPPREKWAPIQAIRTKYDRHVHRWMPHINLLYPFLEMSKFSADQQERFRDACQHFPSFEIQLAEFKFFSHRYNNHTIWLSPEPRDQVSALQKEVLKVVPECNDVNRFKGGYTPHLSVGQVKGRTKLKKLLTRFQSDWEPLSFNVGEIYIISREDQKSSKFSIDETFALSS